jgi:prepilin-type N-terminal cleavage/methylation domain-containing protein
MKARGQERGFTIIELLVVIAIVAILASMAAVSLRPKIKPIDAAERVGDIVREANRVRSRSAPRNVALGLNFEHAGDRQWPRPSRRSFSSAWSKIELGIHDRELGRIGYADTDAADSWDTGVNSKAVLDPTQTDWTTFETSVQTDCAMPSRCSSTRHPHRPVTSRACPSCRWAVRS